MFIFVLLSLEALCALRDMMIAWLLVAGDRPTKSGRHSKSGFPNPLSKLRGVQQNPPLIDGLF